MSLTSKLLTIFALSIFKLSAFTNQSIANLNAHIAKDYQGIIEGHCCDGHSNQPTYLYNSAKRLSQQSPVIAEIGFNAGHSSVLFLESNPNAIVYSFDLGGHPYIPIAKKYIDLIYPNRHHLILENSVTSVPKFTKENPDIKFDLIFIDGGHSVECALADIRNMKAHSKPDTLIIFDDLQSYNVYPVWKKFVKEGFITKETIIESNGRKWVTFHYIFE